LPHFYLFFCLKAKPSRRADLSFLFEVLKNPCGFSAVKIVAASGEHKKVGGGKAEMFEVNQPQPSTNTPILQNQLFPKKTNSAFLD
jgi:hypothetical protein